MSRRLRAKRNARANYVNGMLAVLREHHRGDGITACHYGVHGWRYDLTAELKTCTGCGGVYHLTPTEIAELEAGAL